MFTLAIVNFGHPVQTLEGRAFDRLYAAALLGVTLVLLTTLSQLFVAWLECRSFASGSGPSTVTTWVQTRKRFFLEVHLESRRRFLAGIQSRDLPRDGDFHPPDPYQSSDCRC